MQGSTQALRECTHNVGWLLSNSLDVQGSERPSLIALDTAGEHAALRKVFNTFFSAENIEAVMSQLVQEVQDTFGPVSGAAAASGRGEVTVDVFDLADVLIDNVVRKVRPASPNANVLE